MEMQMSSKHIAVIGAGIAGLSAAWLLGQRHRVSLYERAGRLGGHANTVAVPTAHGELGIDTGFVVFNDRNYPNLVRLFEYLDIPSQATDMSFALSVNGGALEWAGDNLNTLFAQRRNLLRPGFWHFVSEILRFNRDAQAALADDSLGEETLGDYLRRQRYSARFRDDYLLPMAAAIWSCPPLLMERFPVLSFLRFFANHGLLDLVDRPQWRTVCGGSRRYVERLLNTLTATVHTEADIRQVQPQADGVLLIHGNGQTQRVDAVVFACHADEAHALLDARAHAQRQLLADIRYQPNRTLLHRDPTLMPRRRRVWSSWNYLSMRDGRDELAVSVTYWMNRLHRLSCEEQFFVSLNPLHMPATDAIISEQTYHHPVFDAAAQAAQAGLRRLQGQDRLWFTGSYLGYGFHEDALRASLDVAHALGVRAPWETGAPPAPALAAREIA